MSAAARMGAVRATLAGAAVEADARWGERRERRRRTDGDEEARRRRARRLRREAREAAGFYGGVAASAASADADSGDDDGSRTRMTRRRRKEKRRREGKGADVDDDDDAVFGGGLRIEDFGDPVRALAMPAPLASSSSSLSSSSAAASATSSSSSRIAASLVVDGAAEVRGLAAARAAAASAAAATGTPLVADGSVVEFSRQAAAFAHVDTVFSQSAGAEALLPPRVFSVELPPSAPSGAGTGARRFVAARDAEAFWAYYHGHLQEDERCHYELLREGRPCKLYFDLEFEWAPNAERVPDAAAADAAERAFTAFTLVELRRLRAAGAAAGAAAAPAGTQGADHRPGSATATAVNVAATTVSDGDVESAGVDSVIALDSSTTKKYSRHLIFTMPGGERFRSPVDVGVFVHHVVALLSLLRLHWRRRGRRGDNNEDEEEEAAGAEEEEQDGSAVPTTTTTATHAAPEASGREQHEGALARAVREAEAAATASGLTLVDLERMFVLSADGAAELFFADLGVYTRNRNFRLFLSSKRHRAAYLWPATTNSFAFSDHKDLFMASLIADTGGPFPSPAEAASSTVDSHLRTTILDVSGFDKATLAAAVRHLAPVGARAAAARLERQDGNAAADPVLDAWTQAQSLTQAALVHATSSAAAGGRSGTGVGSDTGGGASRQGAGTPSPFPDIEKAVLAYVRWRVSGGGRGSDSGGAGAFSSSPSSSASSHRGRVRAWVHFADSNALVLHLADIRWCGRIGREHRSNNQFYVCDLQERVAVQRCFDPDCRAADYRSGIISLNAGGDSAGGSAGAGQQGRGQTRHQRTRTVGGSGSSSSGGGDTAHPQPPPARAAAATPDPVAVAEAAATAAQQAAAVAFWTAPLPASATETSATATTQTAPPAAASAAATQVGDDIDLDSLEQQFLHAKRLRSV